MSVTISGGVDNVGITVESDPTALKIDQNLFDLNNASVARGNLGLGTAAVASANQLVPAGGTTGQVLAKTSNADFADAWVTPASGGAATDVQVFGSPTTSGTFTWTKPANAKFVDIWLVSGGMGGGSGARYPTTSIRTGGAGGAAGVMFYARVPASSLNATETVSVGAGSTGGAANTVDSSFGTTAQSGGTAIHTSFGNWRAACNTTGGGTGGNNTGTATAGASRSCTMLGSIISSGIGGNGTSSQGQAAGAMTAVVYFPSGGGGGAGAAASVTTANIGGSGGQFGGSLSVAGWNSTVFGGSGGQTNGTQATSGVSLGSTSGYFFAGTGGGGGFYISGQAGGAGGDGGWPGGGGGGGGASDNGFASGRGGNGANGIAVIITYF